MGLIETLWQGFATVIRRPGLVAIPILIDLFAWVGPKVTAASWTEVAQQVLARWLVLAQSESAASVSADQIELVRESMTRQIAAVSEANLVGVVGWLLPGLLGLSGLQTQFVLAPDPTTLIGVVFSFLSIGFFVAAGYYGGMAQAVRGEPPSILVIIRRLPRLSFRLALLLLLAGFAAVAIGGPFLIVVGIIGIFSQAAASVVVLAVPVVVLTLGLLFAFTPSAIFLADIGPLRAMVASARVVLRQPGGTIRFLVTVWILSLGWSVVWSAASQNPIGGALAIVGQGVLSTSLAASTMIFLLARIKVPALVQVEEQK